MTSASLNKSDGQSHNKSSENFTFKYSDLHIYRARCKMMEWRDFN